MKVWVPQAQICESNSNVLLQGPPSNLKTPSGILTQSLHKRKKIALERERELQGLILFSACLTFLCSSPSQSDQTETSSTSSNNVVNISPVHQSSNNPFSRKSTTGLPSSPSPAASPLNVTPAAAPSNPFAKGGVRSSGLTISPVVEALSISASPSPTPSNGSGMSSRRGSDPSIVPPPIISPTTSTKSNASTPRVVREQPQEKKAGNPIDYDRERSGSGAPVRRGSGSSEDGTIARRAIRQQRDSNPGSRFPNEEDVTPRSHHGATKSSSNTNLKNSISASSLPPSRFGFDEPKKVTPRQTTQTTPRNSQGVSQTPRNWQCENTKCQKYNSNDIDYCEFCAVKRGATGARGNAARLFAG